MSDAPELGEIPEGQAQIPHLLAVNPRATTGADSGSSHQTLQQLRRQLSRADSTPQLLGEGSSGAAAATASPTAAGSTTRTSSEQAAGGMLSIVNT